MRWDGLRVTEEPAQAAPQLPLALPGATVRTFDTPGFAGMTFYEVRAKSIINRVPGQSRVPFEWTVNPYRGCTHACVYCLAGETPILLANGRTKPLAELRTGEMVYGTVREGRFRRYTATRVLAHWSTVKPAFRLTLEDGTQLVASGDHRFLTDRGWKFVTGQMSGPGQRPYLTTANKLMGSGHFARPPGETAGYRHGSLRGTIRDDGRVGSTEPEAVDRTTRYLSDLGSAEERLRSGWPQRPSVDWRMGFLAGIYDAKGSHSGGILRITSTDPEIIRHTSECLREFGFSFAVEDRRQPNGLLCVRLVGGLTEKLRFFHTVDPSITRKRTIDGTAIKSGARLGVVSIEPLGVNLPMFDISTETGDFIADGVVSHNCFARNTHTYLDLDAGHDFDTRVVVKVNAGELLRRELAAPGWARGHIAMGTNVDCYQRAEGRYELMRGIIAALRDFANPFSILTKGTLVTRDLDLLRQAAAVTTVGLSMSVGFVDEALWRSVEPGTPSPRRRLETVRRLADAGFEVGVLMAPVLPGLTDTDESIEATVRQIARAGASSVVPLALHLRPGAREWYLAWLAREHPEQLPHYRRLYGDRAYLGSAYQREVVARVAAAARRHGLRSPGSGEDQQPHPGGSRRRSVRPPPRAGPPVEGEQLTLL
ncbi:MAG TPA: intein-containing Rv2578c family radical SAM protein [Micromonosporaceae bacterium]|nr:intein-containing Rv2578c family radical SAM protein [Micromonosporaceae bacterium]